jgi:predicted HAD superfamily Cof-like phosphohydrolase
MVDVQSYESNQMTEVKNTAVEIARNIKEHHVRIVVSVSLHHNATCYDQVEAFHVLYDCPVESDSDPKMANMTDERIALRLSLIEEEFNELKVASEARDVVEVADALGDLIYVVCGYALEAGINLKAVVEEIHASNMTKLDADGSVIRREDGKILKGPNYLKPDIAAVLGIK